jgi:glucosamine--fructose-6-phosphate aminotransferase (isomerizing)
MCGIFGYSGKKQNATDSVFEGLKRLDYRGYDSWGIGIIKDGKILVDKYVGAVDENNLKLPKSSIAVGHTRWATNGAVTVNNAHPHFASDKSFILAHNGIAENYLSIKAKLEKKGYRFVSQTDTEVIVHLIEEKKRKLPNLFDAIRAAFKEFTGRNTIIVLAENGDIIAARNGSPLVIGEADNFSEIYFSSDTFSFAPHVDNILVLDNGQMAIYHEKEIGVFDIQTGKKLQFTLEDNSIINSVIDKQGYEHFMIKEIYEEPNVINKVVEQRDDNYLKFAQAIRKARNVYCIGSGTAGAAAAQMAFYLRVYGGVPVVGLIGAEARDYYNLIGKGDLVITPSQSGETADVLEVIEIVKRKGAAVASFVNMQGSLMTRLSDYKFMAEAGPEICVMSTKIFVSQLAWGYLVAKAVQGKLSEGKANLRNLSKQIDIFLHDKKNIKEIINIARHVAKVNDIFLLSKGQNLQITKEGMVKIIEGSYIHAHAIPAGDLKHYAITLMEPGVQVLFVMSNDDVKSDVAISLHEIKARGSNIIGIAPQREKDFNDYINVPDLREVSAIMNVVPLQLLAYNTASILGHNIDKPRNIAKSVTVK